MRRAFRVCPAIDGALRRSDYIYGFSVARRPGNASETNAFPISYIRRKPDVGEFPRLSPYGYRETVNIRVRRGREMPICVRRTNATPFKRFSSAPVQYRFSAYRLRSKCSICSYQLNIWYAPYQGARMLN